MKIYDITLPLRPELAVWPGDTLYRLERTAQMADGSSVNLGAVTLSLHTGTHADAPYHFCDDGETIDTLPLSVYLGPALLIDVTGKDTIQRSDLTGLDFTNAPRLLLKTGAWQNHAVFPETIPTLAPDVPAFLGAHGVRLLGLDVPSVDALDSKDLPIHHALLANRIHILESLRLDGVPPGRYELIALPLPFCAADASPVRAVLIDYAANAAEEPAGIFRARAE